MSESEGISLSNPADNLEKLEGMLSSGDYKTFNSHAYYILKLCLLETHREVRQIYDQLPFKVRIWDDWTNNVKFLRGKLHKVKENRSPEDRVLEQILLVPQLNRSSIDNCILPWVKGIQENILFENIPEPERQRTMGLFEPESVQRMINYTAFKALEVYWCDLSDYAKALQKFRDSARNLNLWFRQHPVQKKTIYALSNHFKTLRTDFREKYAAMETAYRDLSRTCISLAGCAFYFDNTNPGRGRKITIPTFEELPQITQLRDDLTNRQVKLDVDVQYQTGGSYLLSLKPALHEPNVTIKGLQLTGSVSYGVWGSFTANANLSESVEGAIDVPTDRREGEAFSVDVIPPSHLEGQTLTLEIKYSSPFYKGKKLETKRSVKFERHA